MSQWTAPSGWISSGYQPSTGEFRSSSGSLITDFGGTSGVGTSKFVGDPKSSTTSKEDNFSQDFQKRVGRKPTQTEINRALRLGQTRPKSFSDAFFIRTGRRPTVQETISARKRGDISPDLDAFSRQYGRTASLNELKSWLKGEDILPTKETPKHPHLKGTDFRTTAEKRHGVISAGSDIARVYDPRIPGPHTGLQETRDGEIGTYYRPVTLKGPYLVPRRTYTSRYPLPKVPGNLPPGRYRTTPSPGLISAGIHRPDGTLQSSGFLQRKKALQEQKSEKVGRILIGGLASGVMSYYTGGLGGYAYGGAKVVGKQAVGRVAKELGQRGIKIGRPVYYASRFGRGGEIGVLGATGVVTGADTVSSAMRGEYERVAINLGGFYGGVKGFTKGHRQALAPGSIPSRIGRKVATAKIPRFRIQREDIHSDMRAEYYKGIQQGRRQLQDVLKSMDVKVRQKDLSAKQSLEMKRARAIEQARKGIRRDFKVREAVERYSLLQSMPRSHVMLRTGFQKSPQIPGRPQRMSVPQRAFDYMTGARTPKGSKPLQRKTEDLQTLENIVVTRGEASGMFAIKSGKLPGDVVGKHFTINRDVLMRLQKNQATSLAKWIGKWSRGEIRTRKDEKAFESALRRYGVQIHSARSSPTGYKISGVAEGTQLPESLLVKPRLKPTGKAQKKIRRQMEKAGARRRTSLREAEDIRDYYNRMALLSNKEINQYKKISFFREERGSMPILDTIPRGGLGRRKGPRGIDYVRPGRGRDRGRGPYDRDRYTDFQKGRDPKIWEAGRGKDRGRTGDRDRIDERGGRGQRPGTGTGGRGRMRVGRDTRGGYIPLYGTQQAQGQAQAQSQSPATAMRNAYRQITRAPQRTKLRSRGRGKAPTITERGPRVTDPGMSYYQPPPPQRRTPGPPRRTRKPQAPIKIRRPTMLRRRRTPTKGKGRKIGKKGFTRKVYRPSLIGLTESVPREEGAEYSVLTGLEVRGI